MTRNTLTKAWFLTLDITPVDKVVFEHNNIPCPYVQIDVSSETLVECCCSGLRDISCILYWFEVAAPDEVIRLEVET